MPAVDDDQRIDLLGRNLDRYQAIISRLAGNSVQTKTWCFTAIAGLSAIAVDRDEPAIYAVALGLLAAFFYLDAYYLNLERHFRTVSEDLARRSVSGELVPLDELVTISGPGRAVSGSTIVKCGLSSHVAVIYLAVGVALLAGLLSSV